ncbi:hypothetical protein HYS99_01040 [Candidatus Giovannonibacteria bacterium]|nr:hypothetical protein [Candidatus Giovannonibacteria bacterium]
MESVAPETHTNEINLEKLVESYDTIIKFIVMSRAKQLFGENWENCPTVIFEDRKGNLKNEKCLYLGDNLDINDIITTNFDETAVLVNTTKWLNVCLIFCQIGLFIYEFAKTEVADYKFIEAPPGSFVAFGQAILKAIDKATKKQSPDD